MLYHPAAVHKSQLSRLDRIAIFITKRVGTMWCALLFAAIGIGSIYGMVTDNATLGLLCGAVSSYFLQLVLLPIIMVGQNLQNKHSEILADLTYKAAIDDEHLTRLLIQKVDTGAQFEHLRQATNDDALNRVALRAVLIGQAGVKEVTPRKKWKKR